MNDGDFHGAKLFLVCGNRLLVYRRDDRPDIPFPGLWDLPGGGRENDETPEMCVLRELKEEFDLDLNTDRLYWRRQYENWRNDGSLSFFFGAMLRPEEVENISFGDEGQYWRMMLIDDYLESMDSIKQHRDRLKDFLASA